MMTTEHWQETTRWKSNSPISVGLRPPFKWPKRHWSRKITSSVSRKRIVGIAQSPERTELDCLSCRQCDTSSVFTCYFCLTITSNLSHFTDASKFITNRLLIIFQCTIQLTAEAIIVLLAFSAVNRWESLRAETRRTKQHVPFVFGVVNDEFPVEERNALVFNQLMIEIVGKHAGHPPGRDYWHHDGQHERQVIRQLNLQQHMTSVLGDKLCCLLSHARCFTHLKVKLLLLFLP